jgi:hypothetical protein
MDENLDVGANVGLGLTRPFLCTIGLYVSAAVQQKLEWHMSRL